MYVGCSVENFSEIPFVRVELQQQQEALRVQQVDKLKPVLIGFVVVCTLVVVPIAFWQVNYYSHVTNKASHAVETC